MITAKKFRTKNGYCHIMSDRIVLTHSGFFGRLSALAMEGKMSRILTFFGTLSLVIFYISYLTFQNEESFWGFLFMAIGLYMIYAIAKNARNSVHPIILRNQITEVIQLEEVKGISPPGFEVIFKNLSGKMRKRIISLPGQFSKYPDELRLAKKLLREEGLLH